MGSMFRSEEMVLCQLFVQPEAAYISMYELGEAGIAQFRDEPKTPRSRVPNFTSDEKALLAALIKSKPIVESKATDGKSVDKKKTAWESITQEFNCQAYVYKRDTVNLKRAWDNMKAFTRKARAAERGSLFKTWRGTRKTYSATTPRSHYKHGRRNDNEPDKYHLAESEKTLTTQFPIQVINNTGTQDEQNVPFSPTDCVPRKPADYIRREGVLRIKNLEVKKRLEAKILNSKLNPHVNDFQRRYVSEVRRCSEMERKLRYVGSELPEPPPPPKPSPTVLSPREINILEERIDYIESEIQEITRNAQNLKNDYVSLKELKLLIEKTQTFFQDHSHHRKISASVQVYNNEGVLGHLGFIAGVVATPRVPSFERMLWRISHGNIFFKQAQIDEPLKDPITGHELQKTVFVVFFHGEQIKLRVKKVCHGFQATLYPCPATYKEQQEMLAGVENRIKDMEIVLEQTEQHRRLVLANIARDISTWMVVVRREKAIYHTLNMFSMDIVKKCLIAECWVPKCDLPILQKALDNGVKQSGSPIPSFLHHVPTREIPPTFNRVNKFTCGFQNLIDSYGIASYREVNPALYTIVTFPFLFAVMFGDIGHGIIMTAFAAIVIILEKSLAKKKTDNEIWNIFFGGRYIILLMGIFSIYTGLIYNDIFSKSLNIFGSGWRNVYDNETLMRHKTLELDPATAYTQTPYPFGLDPAWQFASNNIIFLNSFKMKLSIIFGVIHMAFGVTMSVVNFNFFKKNYMIYLQYIPQILFLLLLFWYLCILMFMKWTMYSAVATDPAYGTSCAPSVLIIFINMMLMKKSEVKPPCSLYMYEGQEALQRSLLAVAFLCIPIMLFGKPVYQMMAEKKKKKYQQGVESGEVKEAGGHDGGMGEVLITQAIHTIEYVLGTVSHTASYLRLWALSLAHAQLSAVLWQRVLRAGLGGTVPAGSLMLYVTFAIWAFFTIAILVLMEGLSAFLHTLRLHWVEFMSKFYEGQGYAFVPFSFAAILESEDDELVAQSGGAATE